MVSLITEKLVQQTLSDCTANYERTRQASGLPGSLGSISPKFCKPDTQFTTSTRSDHLNSSSSSSNNEDNGQQQCTCSSFCDILPPKRHRHTHMSDGDSLMKSAHRPYNGSLSDCSETVAASSSSSSSAGHGWRPIVRSSSVWRSVTGQQQQSVRQLFNPRITVKHPELSPLPIRQSMDSERSTPCEESPLSPRPASASSGFFDSSQGSLNFTATEGNSGRAFSYTFAVSCGETLEGGRMSTSENSCLLDAKVVASSESLPVICGDGFERSTPPVSPFNHVDTLLPVRCRSQPTVMTRSRRRGDRARTMGKKRRWPVCDDHRPKLDFLKMKETAYEKTNRFRLRTSHHVQFAADTQSGVHDDTVGWSPSRCCASANCSPLAGSQLPPPPPLSVDDCAAQFRPSVDSCSSDTCEDQPDDDIVAFSEEVNSTFLRGEEGIEEEEGEEVFSVDIENELDIDEIEND